MILLIYGHTLLAAYSLYLAFLTGTLNADQSMLNFEIRLKKQDIQARNEIHDCRKIFFFFTEFRFFLHISMIFIQLKGCVFQVRLSLF